MSSVWDIAFGKRISVVADGKSNYYYPCKYCGRQVSRHPKNGLSHIKSCSAIGDEAREELLIKVTELNGGSPVESPMKRSRISGSSGDASSPDSGRSTTHIAVREYFDNAAEKQKGFEMDTVKMLVLCNLPLSLPDNEFFRNYTKKWTGLQIPSRSVLNKRLLPELSQVVATETRQKLSDARYITLATDSWSNFRNESITNFVALTPKPVFWRAIRNTSTPKDAAFYASQIKNAIEGLPDRNVLSGIVTDNAPVMKAAWKILQPEYPNVHFVGCFAHGLNLFFSDIFSKMVELPFDGGTESASCINSSPEDLSWTTSSWPFLNDDGQGDSEMDDDIHSPTGSACERVTWSCIVVGKYSLPSVAFLHKAIALWFRNHQAERQALLDEQVRLKVRAKQLQLPGNTRWGSIISNISSVVHARSAIKNLLASSAHNRKLKRTKLLDVVVDDKFWKLSALILEACQPLCVLIALLEGDHSNLSFAYHNVLLYERFLSEHSLSQLFPRVLDYFHKRVEFMYNTSVGIAYSLDPRYKGKYLTHQQRKEIRSYISALGNEANEEYHCFITGTQLHGRRCSDALWGLRLKYSPSVWWSFAQDDYPALSNFAGRVLSIVCNSASCERIWSKFSLIHTKIRNKLSAEKTIELCLIYAHTMSDKAFLAPILDPSFKLAEFEANENVREETVQNMDDIFGSRSIDICQDVDNCLELSEVEAIIAHSENDEQVVMSIPECPMVSLSDSE